MGKEKDNKIWNIIIGIIFPLMGVMSLIVTVLEWDAPVLQLRFCLLCCVIMGVAGTILFIKYYKYKTKTNRRVPKMIHLKGICATSHILADLIGMIDKNDLEIKSVRSIILSLSNDVKRRIHDHLGNNKDALQEIEDLCKKIINYNHYSLPDIQETANRLYYDIIHKADRDELEKCGKEDIVYPAPK